MKHHIYFKDSFIHKSVYLLNPELHTSRSWVPLAVQPFTGSANKNVWSNREEEFTGKVRDHKVRCLCQRVIKVKDLHICWVMGVSLRYGHRENGWACVWGRRWQMRRTGEILSSLIFTVKCSSTDELVFCVPQWALLGYRVVIVLIQALLLQMPYLSVRTCHAPIEVTEHRNCRLSLGTAIHRPSVISFNGSYHSKCVKERVLPAVCHVSSIWDQ